ncbi:hypothetical protein ACFOOK_02620 [Micromonospora krabiensis]|uniref:hypothetical protein n=1 Tax=Micromonospora krabiensis TaxID=307121 RepID=UPI001E4EAE73|nr:hypothetical protein [Micromonospora krabiensis]
MAAVMTVVLGLSTIAVASPAQANPQGCTQGDPVFGYSSGYMTAWNDGFCQTSVTRTFRVEIKRDASLSPDPVVSSYDDYYTGTYYYAETSSCDGGRTANYYGRSFFTSHPTYRDTSHYKVTTC